MGSIPLFWMFVLVAVLWSYISWRWLHDKFRSLAHAIFALGIFLNVLVMTCNDGKMPVIARSEMHHARLMKAEWHSPAHANTRLPLLIDRIPWGTYTYSVGDIVMFFGFSFIVVSYIRRFARRR